MFVLLLMMSIFGTISHAFQSADQVTLSIKTPLPFRFSNVPPCAHYAAFGDSYLAGLNANRDEELSICKGSMCGINTPYQTEANCARNKASYPWQFQYHSLNKTPACSNFTFTACSGANTTNVLQNQIPAIPAQTDLITFTIGFNDGWCKTALANVIANAVHIGPSLDTVYQKLRDGWPEVTIVALGYAQFWATATYNKSNCNSIFLKWVDPDTRAAMNEFVLVINSHIAQAAQRAGIGYLNYDHLFEGSRLRDQKPSYFQYLLFGGLGDGRGSGNDDSFLAFYNRGVFHPNAQGQSVIRNALTLELQDYNSYSQSLLRDEI